MENKTINIQTIAEVARGLKELRTKMVFVGGAVISLYTDDEAAEEIRPTGDIITSNPYLEEIIRAQIHPLIVDDRYPIVLDKIKRITS